ncbi:MAG: type III pantothenate kinase [Bacteroidota bacterium]
MRLALDIGNTRTKYGIFENDQIVEKGTWQYLEIDDLNAALTNHSIRNIIYSNVSQLSTKVAQWLAEHQAVELTSDLKLPIDYRYKTPQTLGKDRIAAVMGAHQLYPHQNSLVIDAGTCITYDWLIDGHIYLGGNIAPGIWMRLRAMHEGTSALPLVPMEWQTAHIGESTIHALQNGALWGAVLEMQGVIDWSTQQWARINIILTGGDGIFFANHLKRKIFAASDLVLQGLNEILNYHVSLEE